MDYLGVDISQKTIDAALLLGEKVKYKRCSNDLEGFDSLLLWLKQHSTGELRICMEATGKYWEALAEYLTDKKLFVSVCNPAQVKGFGKSELQRAKTDKLDAALIARFCRALTPVQWHPMDKQQRALRDMQRYTENLTAQRVQEHNRLKSGRLEKIVKLAIEEHLSYLDSKIKELETEMLTMVRSNQHMQEDFSLLTSIKGVGPATAIMFLGELGSAKGFTNARALEAFCGVAPRLFESGTSIRARSRMSKVGSSSVRKFLYMPALAASRCNPIFTAFKKRLKAAGKPGRVIICAIMRKLLRLMFAVLKSRKPFDPAYISRFNTHEPVLL